MWIGTAVMLAIPVLIVLIVLQHLQQGVNHTTHMISMPPPQPICHPHTYPPEIGPDLDPDQGHR